MATRKMILCADDYGLREDINRAVLELCGSGRLSAVSCMVLFEDCSAEVLASLLGFQERIDVGLHLCLTHEEPGLCSALAGNGPAELPAYGSLLRRALSGRVQPGDVARQLAAQYELFIKKCGRAPDYIDGHLHVHQLPGVQAGVLEFVLSLPEGSRPYVRNTGLPLRELWRRRLPWVKPALIGVFGTRMCQRLRAAGIRTNQGFAGIYDFRNWRRYPDYFPGFVSCLENPNGLLVVHPGENDQWRQQELATLRQFPFPPGRLNRFRSA